MFFFFNSLDSYLIFLLNILLLNLVSTFSLGTSSIYLIFIVVVSYLLFVAGSQLANSKKFQYQVLCICYQLGRNLDGIESFCIALPLLLTPQEAEERRNIFRLYKRGQLVYSELCRTIRKIKEIARKQLCGHSLFLPLTLIFTFTR